jgi:CubicO group peptidase (beta-lactamase class C family)
MTEVPARVRDALVPLIDGADLPGASWALVTGTGREQRTHVESAGTYADDTIFRIASLTKPVVGVLVARLVADGVLALEDPVEHWVPELAERRVLRTPDAQLHDVVAANRPLTVGDALEMGAGLGWGPVLEGTPLQRAQVERQLESTWLPPTLEPDEWLAALARTPMAHQPGEGWLYQMSYDLLALVLERAAGADLDVVLADRVLRPLGMNSTGWHVAAEDLHRVPAQHFPDGSGGWDEVSPAADPAIAERPAFRSAATGLHATAGDLARLGAWLLEDEVGARLAQDRVGPAARAMCSADLGSELGWGHGCAVDLVARYPGSRAGRFGWYGGTGTSMWTDREAGISAVLLTQRGMGGPGPDVHELFWSAVHAV